MVLKMVHSARRLLADQAGSQTRLFLKKAQAIEALDRETKQHLPGDLAQHCRVLNFDKGKLLIEVENSSWANLLKFQKPELLAYLRKTPAFASVSNIAHVIKMDSVMPHPPVKHKKPNKMGKEALDSLKSTLDHTSDETLKKKLAVFLAHQKQH